MIDAALLHPLLYPHPGAALATRVIASFLFETSPTDPVTFAAVVIVIAVAALAAAWVPSRGALRVDPVSALRAE